MDPKNARGEQGACATVWGPASTPHEVALCCGPPWLAEATPSRCRVPPPLCSAPARGVQWGPPATALRHWRKPPAPRLAQDGHSSLPGVCALCVEPLSKRSHVRGGRWGPALPRRLLRNQHAAARLLTNYRLILESGPRRWRRELAARRREEAEAWWRCLRGGEPFWKPGCAVCVAGAP